LIAVDENGHELTGDHILAISARQLLERKELKKKLVVITPMANLGLRQAFDRMGIHVREADVGDRNVLADMQKHGSILGGEQSGHIIFLNQHTTGDGIVSALHLLSVMKRSNQKLSQLAKVMSVCPQLLINIPVRSRVPLHEAPLTTAAIKAVEKKLGKRGRVLVRYSGTQALCRVMVESPTTTMTKNCAEMIARVIRDELA
jgi:phosphoglucosamine mutase